MTLAYVREIALVIGNADDATDDVGDATQADTHFRQCH
jgi:hypothetical protein